MLGIAGRMLGYCLHIHAVTLNAFLQSRDLFRELFEDFVLQRVFLTQVVCFQKFQARHINIQVHLLFDIRVARTQCLDFGIRECLLVNILRRTHRAFTRHDLTDEFLLAFDQLIKVTVEGVFGNIGVDVHFGVFIALSNDTTFSLLQIRRSPGAVKMMEGYQTLLYICACTHFLSRADEDSDLTASHLSEHFLFLNFGIGGVNIGNFFGGNAFGNEFVSQIVIDIELVITVRRGEIAEYHLRGFLLFCALPNIKDIIGTGRHFARFTIREHIVHHTLVECKFTPVVCDKQHIVNGGINHLIADSFGSLGQCFNHFFLLFRRF